MTIEDKARKSIGAKRNPASAAAILEAAEAVLAERGCAGFTIEAVARRARAGKPTIYRWWPSKAALLIDVYQRQKRVAVPDTGDIEQDLRGFLRNLFDHWRDTPSGSIFRSLIAEAQSDVSAAKALSDYGRSRRSSTGAIIERAMARGEVAADVDPLVAADMIASFAWTHLLTDRLDAGDTEIGAAVRCLVRGIAARAA